MMITKDSILSGHNEVAGKDKAGTKALHPAIDLGNDRLFGLNNELERVLERL